MNATTNSQSPDTEYSETNARAIGIRLWYASFSLFRFQLRIIRKKFLSYFRPLGYKMAFLVFAVSVEEAEIMAYITGNGRMTIPKEVRDVLGIEEGNLVKCKLRKVET